MTNKRFCELTSDQATALAKSCKLGAKSEDEIRRRLTEAGFNGTVAALTSLRRPGLFMAMGTVWGPQGEVISF